MTTDEMILERLRTLPPDKQSEVSDFVEFLHQRNAPSKPLRNPRGIWKGLCADITLEEFRELRREMWGDFPREISS